VAELATTAKGRIESASGLSAPHPDDGPFLTADGRYAFATISVTSGTYLSADGISLAGVKSRFGFTDIKEIIGGVGAVAENGTLLTGMVKFRFDDAAQKLFVLQGGNSGAAPIDEVAINSVTFASSFDCLILGN